MSQLFYPKIELIFYALDPLGWKKTLIQRVVSQEAKVNVENNGVWKNK